MNGVTLRWAASIFALCAACRGPSAADESGAPAAPPGDSATSGGDSTPRDSASAGDSTAGDITAGDTGGSPPQILFMTYNLLHGFPWFVNLDARTDAVVATIDALQPDVIGLQEVGKQPGKQDQAQLIAARTGYYYYFEPTNGFDFAFQEGPGLLSRWPILSANLTVLPDAEYGGLAARSIVTAEIDSPYGTLTVYSTHLSGSNETTNMNQSVAVLEEILAHPSPLPGFVGGDFNMSPDENGSLFLSGTQTYAGLTSPLVDAWLAVNPNDPGLTEPSSSPSERIDYVYVVPGSDTPGVVNDCILVLDQPDGDLYASDHIGVMCTVELR